MIHKFITFDSFRSGDGLAKFLVMSFTSEKQCAIHNSIRYEEMTRERIRSDS